MEKKLIDYHQNKNKDKNTRDEIIQSLSADEDQESTIPAAVVGKEREKVESGTHHVYVIADDINVPADNMNVRTENINVPAEPPPRQKEPLMQLMQRNDETQEKFLTEQVPKLFKSLGMNLDSSGSY